MKSLHQSRSSGFTVIELLTLVAVATLLAGLLLPARANARGRSASVVCLNNQRQLMLAWQAYNSDSRGRLVSSLQSGPPVTRPVWVTGYLDFRSADSTNRRYLAEGPLFKYGGKSFGIYQCPADRSVTGTIPEAPRSTPRTRSYSMSQVFDFGAWLPSPPYWTYSIVDDIADPANTMVFVEEHPDSINDGAFALEMVEPDRMFGNIIDMPSSNHQGRAGSFGFSDGHTEMHRWIGRTITPGIRYNGQLALNIPARDSLVDVKWLSQRTTVRR